MQRLACRILQRFRWSDAGSAPEGIRTPNLLIRSQTLYPLSYGRTFQNRVKSVPAADGAG
jgi:hypothetical protein